MHTMGQQQASRPPAAPVPGDKGPACGGTDEPDRAGELFKRREWHALTQLVQGLEYQPRGRAETAVRIGAAFLALGDDDQGRVYIGLARDWGASGSLIAEILSAVLHDTLGRAFVAAGRAELASEQTSTLRAERLAARALQHLRSASPAVADPALMALAAGAGAGAEVEPGLLALLSPTKSNARSQQGQRSSAMQCLSGQAPLHASVELIPDTPDLPELAALFDDVFPGLRNTDLDLAQIVEKERTIRLLHLRGDYIPGRIAREGRFYEAEFLALLAEFHRPDGFFIDCGANIGNHTLYFCCVLDAEVISIEPEPHNFACLSMNVSLNRVTQQVQLENVALGAYDGRIKLAMSIDSNFGSFSAKEAKNPRETRPEHSFEVEVPLTTLDAVTSRHGCQHRVSIVKVDVEGMEFEVLEGALQTLQASLPAVAVECFRLEDLARIEQLIAYLGYFPIAVTNATPTFVFVSRRNPFHMAGLTAHLRAGAVARAAKSKGFL